MCKAREAGRGMNTELKGQREAETTKDGEI